MADAKLKIIISAVDNASGPLGGIGKAMSGLGGIAKGALLGGIGAAVAGVGALGAVLISSTKEAMAAEVVQAQLAAVLKSTGGVAGVTAEMANGLADSLSKVTRFDDEAILSGENLLLTFTNIGKDVFPMATETMLDMSTALGQDLKSSALQLGKALNDPIKGMTALRKAGVSFTEEQVAQVTALQKSGDMMGAQKIILAELAKEFGGAAQAAGGTLAGQMDILKNSLANVKESIGAALIPVLTSLATEYGPQLIAFAGQAAEWFTTKLIPAIVVLVDWLKVVLPPTIQFLTDAWNLVLLPALTAIYNFIVDPLIPTIALIVTWLEKNIPKAIAWAVEAWTDLQRSLAAVKGVIDDVIAGISSVITWFSTARDNIAKIQIPNPFSGLLSTIQAIGGAVQDALNWLSKLPNGGGVTVPPSRGGGRGGFASGTSYAPGGMALVGERGPELVNLPRGSRVYPAGQTAGMLGGTYNITLNITGARDPVAVGQQARYGVLAAARAMGVR